MTSRAMPSPGIKYWFLRLSVISENGMSSKGESGKGQRGKGNGQNARWGYGQKIREGPGRQTDQTEQNRQEQGWGSEGQGEE